MSLSSFLRVTRSPGRAGGFYAALACVAACASAAPPADGEKVFVGYVYGRTDGIDFSLYTHLCHAFVVADGDGTFRQNRRAPSRELTAAAHKHSVKVLLSLGGWGWDDEFAAMVADPAAEDRYVTAVLAMSADYGYDGIDLDWEYPDTADEVVGFERLVRRLRAGLNEQEATRGAPLLLTMAAGANPRTLAWLDTEFLLETMDWVNVMTYDYAGAWTNRALHNAPLHASSKLPDGAASIEQTIKFLIDERKMPPQRVALGLPLYGRGFAVAEPYASTDGAPRARHGSVDYNEIIELQHDGWQREWDDDVKAPWLMAPDGKEVISYDDAESLAGKTSWAMEQGLRGVFFWEVNADQLEDGSHPLQEAAREALTKATPASK
jgi:chitinase